MFLLYMIVCLDAYKTQQSFHVMSFQEVKLSSGWMIGLIEGLLLLISFVRWIWTLRNLALFQNKFLKMTLLGDGKQNPRLSS